MEISTEAANNVKEVVKISIDKIKNHPFLTPIVKQ